MQLALKVLAMHSLLKLPLILSVFVFLFGLWVSLVLLITQFGISWECYSSDFAGLSVELTLFWDALLL